MFNNLYSIGNEIRWYWVRLPFLPSRGLPGAQQRPPSLLWHVVELGHCVSNQVNPNSFTQGDTYVELKIKTKPVQSNIRSNW